MMWVGLNARTEKARDWLSKSSELQKLALRSLIAEETRPRARCFGDVWAGLSRPKTTPESAGGIPGANDGAAFWIVAPFYGTLGTGLMFYFHRKGWL